MRLIFVHGWSVTHTNTYGDLPRILRDRAPRAGFALETIDIHLGRYISFRNEVRMDDVVRAFNQALRDAVPDGNGGIAPFSCVTHSTGGPVLRAWLARHYPPARLPACPLEKLVMLAPANHGSPLAALGSSRLGRIKAWFQGVEPGEGILRWLELGSEESRMLNRAWLDYDPMMPGSRFRPFVLTGETIDSKLYDHVNSYTGEVGSDGVVRSAGANLNYSWITLRQTDELLAMKGGGEASRLVYVESLQCPAPTPFLIVPKAAHSGEDLGIMRSPNLRNADDKPVVAAILEALALRTKKGYASLIDKWSRATETEQSSRGRRRRFFQLIVRVTDDQGLVVPDFDFVLIGGADYDPNKLPKGFFIDKQLNRRSPQTITFYLDFDAMMAIKDEQFGFRVLARPSEGFAYYQAAEFRSDAITIDRWADPNSTLYLDIILKRHVDRETARLDPAANGPESFKGCVPAGVCVP